MKRKKGVGANTFPDSLTEDPEIVLNPPTYFGQVGVEFGVEGFENEGGERCVRLAALVNRFVVILWERREVEVGSVLSFWLGFEKAIMEPLQKHVRKAVQEACKPKRHPRNFESAHTRQIYKVLHEAIIRGEVLSQTEFTKRVYKNWEPRNLTAALKNRGTSWKRLRDNMEWNKNRKQSEQ